MYNPRCSDYLARFRGFQPMTNETSEKAGRKWFDILFKNKAGMWTAIFTGILSIFTFFLWNVAQSTDETSRSSQRAFLNFSQLGLGVNLTGPDFKAWVGQEFSLNWVNSGNTERLHAFPKRTLWTHGRQNPISFSGVRSCIKIFSPKTLTGSRNSA